MVVVVGVVGDGVEVEVVDCFECVFVDVLDVVVGVVVFDYLGGCCCCDFVVEF